MTRCPFRPRRGRIVRDRSPDQTDSWRLPDLQAELMRVLSNAVQELELTWSRPEEHARSKPDSWYLRSTRKADSRASVPFFPGEERDSPRSVEVAP